MKSKTTWARLLGGLLMAVALLPWLGGTAAQAAVTVHVDQKWIGFNSATGQISHASCAYDEVKQTHSGVGWHFVMTGGSGLTTLTVHFNTGDVTVTTTETAAGVIVQDGKGAVVYTSGNATLVAGVSGYPGDGSAAVEDVLQLSHICSDTTTPSTPVSTPATTPASTPATTPASVAPTTAKASPSTSVKGVKNAKPPAVLPHTGGGLPVGLSLAVSIGLLLAGAALIALPRKLAVERGTQRRH